MIVIGKDTNIETQNNKKDSQQDTRIDSLQTAVDSLNAQVSAINASIETINASINDKYSAQTQTLMSALTSQINALSEALSSVVSTAQVSANIGNFERLAATISATITSLSAEIATITEKATIEEAEINMLDVNIANVGTLGAIVANLETVNAELINVTSFVVTSLTVRNFEADNINAETVESKSVTADKVSTLNITGKGWHTPISTPDNTELLHITIPNIDGEVLFLTQDGEFSISILNNYLISYNQQDSYIYRIERNENRTDLYLMNVGDTVNYRCLCLGADGYVIPTSEIVDRTGYKQNILDKKGILALNSSNVELEILYIDFIPATGESGILYLSRAQGGYIWNEETEQWIPLMGTNWQDWIGDLSQLTTTANTSLVEAVNELDDKKYDKTGGLISGDVIVDGETTLNNDVFAEKNLKVKGDLIVEGQTLTTEEQTLATDSNYAVLRKNNPSGLASGEKSGVVIHNYQTGKNASFAVSNDGEFRVSDNVAETTTTYTNLAKFGNTYYSGLDSSTVATVAEGAAVSEDVDVVADCVLETTSGKWYHSLNAEWFEMLLVNNALSFDKESPVTDETLIATLETLTKQNLFYFRSLSILVISDSTDQPLLTREESEDLKNNDILVWDETNKKATKAPRPAGSGLVLTSVVNNENVSYQWGPGADLKADLEDLAEAFDSSETYSVGDYVTYSGDVYICTALHSGAWSASDFDKVTVGEELEKKVEKEAGKGLSTNDFTDTLKDKLDGIEAGAQVNTITGVKGDSESDYRTGNVNITKTNIGLGNVDNVRMGYTDSVGEVGSFISGSSKIEINITNGPAALLPSLSKVKILFTAALESYTEITGVQLTYCGRTGNVVVPRGGNLIPLVSHKFTAGNYDPSFPHKVWDALTELELLWTGSYWLVCGNPTLCSYFSTDFGYEVKANGLIEQWSTGIDSNVTAGWQTQQFDFAVKFENKPVVTCTSLGNSQDEKMESFILYTANNQNFQMYRYRYNTYRGWAWRAIGY